MERKKRFLALALLSFLLAFFIPLLRFVLIPTGADKTYPPAYEEIPLSEVHWEKGACTRYTIPGDHARRDVPREDPRPAVAIIIDDLGYDEGLAMLFMGLDLELTLSVLPSAPFTAKIVEEGHSRGREIMLHQPMEPKCYPAVDPGPGALLVSMGREEIIKILNRNLREVKGARGVNNHMGSSFTENQEKMGVVLGELKRRGLFFIDSRTTTGTVGLELARKIGLPAAERTVFLDNVQERKAITTQIEHLLYIARNCGMVIGIAHPHIETLEILEEYEGRLGEEFHLVPASGLVQ